MKFWTQPFCGTVVMACVALLAPGSPTALGQTALGDGGSQPATNTGPQESWRLSNDQLDSLVAPIALYPDPLLSQTLVASTYPLEIIQLQQWLERNKQLKDKALADAVQMQPWDPSIQSLVAVPDVIARCAGNIQWTTELGNAFLAQPEDVMDAVQRMRAKAQAKNALVSNSQQTVGTEVIEGEQVIVVQQADPKVVYVPSYDPVVVYGAPAYPYPSYYYSGYVPGSALVFGAGIALGAAWGNGWGYNCGWGHGDVNVNVNNNYIRKSGNVSNINGGKWQHQAAHRGGTPYGRGGIKGVGGGTRPGGVGGVGRPGGVGGAGRPGGVGGVGGAGRPGGVGGIGGASGIGGPGGAGKPGGAGGIGGPGKPGGAGGIGGAGGAGGIGGAGGVGGAGKPGGAGGIGSPGGVGGGAGKPGGVGGISGPGGADGIGNSGGINRPSGGATTRPSSNSIGGRSVSSGSSSSRSSFGGSGYSGSSARASSSRGSSSMRSSGGGGRSGGGRSGGGGRGRR